jgi:hypothetical protein
MQWEKSMKFTLFHGQLLQLAGTLPGQRYLFEAAMVMSLQRTHVTVSADNMTAAHHFGLEVTRT